MADQPSASVVNTTAVGMTAASLADIILWASNGMPHPMPDDVALAFAGGMVAIAHASHKYAPVAWRAWCNRPKKPVPAAPPPADPKPKPAGAKS